MSDLGNDAGSTALSITAKVAEAILKLIDKLFAFFSAERRLTRQKLKQAKTENEKAAALKELNGKVGKVNQKLMRQTGLPLHPQDLYITPEDMKRFTSIAHRYGIQWYGVMSKEPVKPDGKHLFEAVFYEKDMPKVREVFERVKAEIVAERRDKRIAELEGKGDKRSKEEEQELQTLYKERDGEKQAVCDQVNDKTAGDVAQGVKTGEAPREDTFDAILNERTGKHIDKDVYSVLVDPADPSKFILCHGQQAVDPKGDEYVKTDYKVFKNDVLVAETHDGRFKGRTDEYWAEQKALMKEAGDFGDKLLKFPSVEAAQKWRDSVEKENEEELGAMPEFKLEDFAKRPYAESQKEAFDPNREKVVYTPKAKPVDGIQTEQPGKVTKKMSLDEALDRNAVNPGHFRIVDADAPSKYIDCEARIVLGEDRVEAYYKVYKDGKLVMETNDGRGDGRTDDWWQQEKNNIKAAAGFGDKVEVFKLDAEPVRGSDGPETPTPPEVATEPVTALHARKLSGDIDYKTIRLQLGDTLEKNGFRLDESKKVVFDNGEPLPMITADMDPKDQMLIAEAKVIQNQYAAYAKMEDLEEKFELAKAEAMVMDEGTEEYVNALVDMNNLEASYKETVKEAETLKEQRREINGVQVEQRGRAEREVSKEAEISKDKTGKEKDTPEEDGPSDRASRTVDHRNRPTMDQWEKEVEKKRGEKSAELTGKDIPKIRPGKGKDIGGRD